MTQEPPAILLLCVHNAGRSLDEVRRIRDDIRRRVAALLRELGVPLSADGGVT